MNIAGLWSDLMRRRAEDWVFAPLEPNQTPDKMAVDKVVPDAAYVEIFLKSMRIVDVRRGVKKFFGTVHSFTSLDTLAGKPAQFNVVTTPNQLRNVDASNLDRVININQRLLGPIPYRGGDLVLETGLFSVVSADLTAPYVDLLQKVSGIAGVSFLQSALPFVEPIKEGVNLLLGSQGDSMLEVGLATRFTAPETRYYVVMRAPKTSIKTSDLRIDPNDFKVVDIKGTAITNAPYMVIQVMARDTRDDWFNIPELLEHYDLIRDAVRRQNQNDARAAFEVFQMRARTCNDLISSHADLLVQKVEAQLNTWFPGTKTGAVLGKKFPHFKELGLFQ